MHIVKSSFGVTPSKGEVSAYRLSNQNGMYIDVIDFGAILVRAVLKDREGNPTDVVLGYDTIEGYLDNGCYFGSTIGRSGNRIAGGRFNINGETYQLEQNENENNLHSGPLGYQQMFWDVLELDETENSITFGRVSKNMEQGYPGTFDIKVKYELTEENEILIHYLGISDKDTVANLTNHSYFNLSGHDSGQVLDQKLCIHAQKYTPVADSRSIPTGELAEVGGTPMDFTSMKPIGKEIGADFQQLHFTGGYDHNYALDDYEPGIIRPIAKAYSEKSGITMEVFTDLPGVQFYSGNFIDNEVGKEGAVYTKRSGFCLETQYYPNAVNQQNFPSPILKAGEEYNTVTIYQFYEE